MSRINIRKGFSLPIVGEAEKVLFQVDRAKFYQLRLDDFHGIIPKMRLKEGDVVKAGDIVFSSKKDMRINFVSPVNGTIAEIKRGAKRKILYISIRADEEDTPKTHNVSSVSDDRASIKEILLESGCWPFIKQRPYDVIANPDDTPKSIFISAYNTAFLGADIEYALKDSKNSFQKGIEILSKLTDGKVHLSIMNNSNSFFKEIKGVEIHYVKGVHPAGNVGVQIHHIDPINPGECVWVASPQDVVVIGKFFETGVFDAQRVIAVAGIELNKPHYTKLKIGAQVESFVDVIPENSRIISGNILTGTKISVEQGIGFYDDTLSVIPEGNKYRMLGWMPFINNRIPSFYSTSLFRLFSSKKKKVKVDTNLNGEERAMVVTGKMEKVFPMDIYPMQLLKECLAQNIEKMEELGIYEVSPEDFALIDYISTSKLEAQQIIRESLDLLMQEVG